MSSLIKIYSITYAIRKFSSTLPMKCSVIYLSSLSTSSLILTISTTCSTLMESLLYKSDIGIEIWFISRIVVDVSFTICSWNIVLILGELAFIQMNKNSGINWFKKSLVLMVWLIFGVVPLSFYIHSLYANTNANSIINIIEKYLNKYSFIYQYISPIVLILAILSCKFILKLRNRRTISICSEKIDTMIIKMVVIIFFMEVLFKIPYFIHYSVNGLADDETKINEISVIKYTQTIIELSRQSSLMIVLIGNIFEVSLLLTFYKYLVKKIEEFNLENSSFENTISLNSSNSVCNQNSHQSNQKISASTAGKGTYFSFKQ